VGRAAAIIAEDAAALHIVAGVAESPEELAALASPQNKRFAVYEPMDRFALRTKPVMSQMAQLAEQLNEAFIQESVAGELTERSYRRTISLVDQMLEVQKSHPEFFDPEDFTDLSEFRALLVGGLVAWREDTPERRLQHLIRLQALREQLYERWGWWR
jgi:hypothetical protein